MDAQNPIVPLLNRIHVGCRVQGPYGQLLPNPKGSKRRVRSRSYGTVMRALHQQKWEIMYDFDGARKPASSKQLTIVPDDAGVPAHELSGVLQPTIQAAAIATNISNNHEVRTTKFKNNINSIN